MVQLYSSRIEDMRAHVAGVCIRATCHSCRCSPRCTILHVRAREDRQTGSKTEMLETDKRKLDEECTETTKEWRAAKTYLRTVLFFKNSAKL